MRNFIDLIEDTQTPTAWWFDPRTAERLYLKDGMEHPNVVASLGIEMDPESGGNTRIQAAIKQGFVRVRFYSLGRMLAVEASNTRDGRKAVADALRDFQVDKLFLEIGDDYHDLDAAATLLFADKGKILEANLPLRPGVIKNSHGAYGAFVVVMSPYDFLELTTSNEAQLQAIKNGTDRDRPFPQPDDEYNKDHEGLSVTAGRFDMPFLYVQFPSGKVTGHEGRHRAAMVHRSGGKSFPVMIYPREDDRFLVRDIYRDDDWNEHEIDTEYHSRRDAEAHEYKLLLSSLHDEPMLNGWTYLKTKIKVLHGEKLRGAPARSVAAYQYAAWKVEDFPKALVSQFNDWNKVTRFKVGLVKGYTHHREPVTESATQPNRTLYHGTSIEALKNIHVTGLEPRIGEMTRSAYDIVDEIDPNDDGDTYSISADDVPELVFAADRKGLGRCYSAMLVAIEQAYGIKDYSAETIAKYGALLFIHRQGDSFEYRPREHEEDHYQDHPHTVETGDYYTESRIMIDAVLTGRKLVQFLVRNRIGFSSKSDMSTRQMLGKAVKILIKMGRTPEQALERARELGVHGCYNFVQRMDD
jgi:hypothetical protein